MRKTFILLLFITIFCLSINQVYACSIDPTPFFYIKTNDLKNCHFTSYSENISSSDDIVEFIKNRTSSYEDCDNLVLTESEQEIFGNVINQFNKQYFYLLNKNYHGFASVNIEKQSNEEYAIFQHKIGKINSNKCDCRRYDNVTRHDSWTVYVKAGDCPIDSMCLDIPPEGCTIEQSSSSHHSDNIRRYICHYQ